MQLELQRKNTNGLYYSLECLIHQHPYFCCKEIGESHIFLYKSLLEHRLFSRDLEYLLSNYNTLVSKRELKLVGFLFLLEEDFI